MRGIKPTPLKLYFIATPATDGPSLATPSKSCFYYSPIPFASMLVAPSSHPIPVLSILSLSRFLHFSHLHSCTIVYTTSQYGGEQSHPLFPPPNSLFPSLPPSLTLSLFLSPLRHRPSRRGVSPYNETPETSLQIQPLGGARYLSSEAFLSFGCIPDVPLSLRRAHSP